MNQKKKPRHTIEPEDIQRVMDVAARLFSENGYDGVGIRQIASESHVAMPTILYHFGSKQSLYEEVLDYLYAHHKASILQAVKQEPDPRRKIEKITTTLFDLLMRDRIFLMLLHRDIVDLIANKKRPVFIKEYLQFLEMASELLDAALNVKGSGEIAFTYVATIVGFSEMTAVIVASQAPGFDSEWYEKRRSELINVGNKICGVTR